MGKSDPRRLHCSRKVISVSCGPWCLGDRGVGRGGGISRGGGVGGGWVLSVAKDELDADLLGQGELDLLAGGGTEDGVALLDGLDGILNFGDGDALLLGQVLAGDAGKGDGLVDAGLDGLGVGDLDGDIDGGDEGVVEGGLLGNFLAVLVSVASVASVTTISGLANSDHLDLDFLNEGDLNSLGGGVFLLLLVGEGADLVGDLLDALSADGADNVVAELLVDDLLDGELDRGALGVEGGGADLGDLGHIVNAAVVLGLLVDDWAVSGGRGVGRGRGIGAVGRGVVAGDEGEEGQEGEDLM